jgi:uncharacterized protein (TIGR01777 family)
VKVCVLGASGFVGRHLTQALAQRGDTVVEASLRDPASAAAVAAPCDAVVNLAGEPVAQRWTAGAKRRIFDSRTQSPRAFFDTLATLERTAATYVSASGIGYYGIDDAATFTEANPAGDDFLARVCVAWEAQALAARQLGMRVGIVRTGLALGTDGGALAKLLPPFRLGLGGVVGNGRQWYSWIHIDDVVGIYLAVLDRGDGAYNATAPNPVTNAEFTHGIARTLHRPAIVPVPAFAVRALLGEAASVLLTGQRVVPQRTSAELHYRFAFADLDAAMQALASAR